MSKTGLSIFFAALIDLDLFQADIQNSYLTCPCKDKVHADSDSVFGPSTYRRSALVVCALFGLKNVVVD
jgi:hypothetical protein